MYDYYLGGKNNYAADRDAAEKILSLMPEARQWVKENRLFLSAAVSHLAGLGVRQFIDVGAGLPTQNSVHEVAPDARVVYVDNDPVGDVNADVVKAGRQVYSGSSAGSITPRSGPRDQKGPIA